jgi:hypothetical protein
LFKPAGFPMMLDTNILIIKVTYYVYARPQQ